MAKGADPRQDIEVIPTKVFLQALMTMLVSIVTIIVSHPACYALQWPR